MMALIWRKTILISVFCTPEETNPLAEVLLKKWQ